MTKEEALNRLNEIQSKHNIGRATREDIYEFNRIQREVLFPLGYKLRRSRKNGMRVWVLSERISKEKREERNNSRFVCEWVNEDVSPEHKHLKGNCTTRSMTYALGGSMTYDQIEEEQYRFAVMCGTRRNARGTWEKVLLDRGWGKMLLCRHIRRDRLAVMLRSIGCPIVTVSSGHACVIDGGKVIDNWDSRGGFVTEIVVRLDVMDSVKRAMGWTML